MFKPDLSFPNTLHGCLTSLIWFILGSGCCRLHHKIEPVKHDGDSPPLTELSKEDLKNHKQELKQSHDQTANRPDKAHKLQAHMDPVSNTSSMHTQKGQ